MVGKRVPVNEFGMDFCTMSSTYYRLWYRLDHTDGYLIWFSNDTDGVVTESNGTVPSFRDQAALRDYAATQQMTLDAMEPALHDLDVVVHWLSDPQLIEVDCKAFLVAWNLFSDLASSVNGVFDLDWERTQQVYDKLFWGNNLSPVTPPGEHYIPQWGNDERLVLREILHEGLELFRTYVEAH